MDFLSNSWAWFLDENNRAAAVALASGAFILITAIVAGGWAIFVYFHRRKETDSTPASTTITPPGEPTKPHPDVQALADKAMKACEEKGAALQQVQNLEQENRELRIAVSFGPLVAPVDAVHQRLAKAIEGARRRRDLVELDRLLDAAVAELDAHMKQWDTASFAFHRMSAVVAYKRGDMPKAHARAETVLLYFPDDPYALIVLGNIHLLQGRPADATRCFERVLDLSGGRDNE